MIDMRLALAPAGVSAWGALDVRAARTTGLTGVLPYTRPRYAPVRSLTPFGLTGTACAAAAAPIQGTGLPTAAPVAEPFGTGVLGTAVFGTAVFGTDAHRTDIDNSTTLGIHSPGRPQS